MPPANQSATLTLLAAAIGQAKRSLSLLAADADCLTVIQHIEATCATLDEVVERLVASESCECLNRLSQQADDQGVVQDIVWMMELYRCLGSRLARQDISDG